MLKFHVESEAESPDAELRAAGEPAVDPHRCVACGYGVAAYDVLPRCPMCAGDLWKPDTAAAARAATARQ